jgi:hypothetical protein
MKKIVNKVIGGCVLNLTKRKKVYMIFYLKIDLYRIHSYPQTCPILVSWIMYTLILNIHNLKKVYM